MLAENDLGEPEQIGEEPVMTGNTDLTAA